jgi:hypothetical protein
MELDVSFSAFRPVMYALEATVTIPPTWPKAGNQQESVQSESESARGRCGIRRFQVPR